MGLELVGFAGGALVGALGMAAWLHDRDMKHVGAVDSHMLNSLSALMRTVRLYTSAPKIVACPHCGEAGLVAASLPFTGANSQN